MVWQKGLMFSLGHFNLCSPAQNMVEVILIPKSSVREIPGVKSLFTGLFIYRDHILPLLNLRLLFHLGQEEEKILAIGVMSLSDGAQFGLTIVEETEIVEFDDQRLIPLDRAPRGIDAKFFKGYIQSYGKMIFILEVDYFQKYLRKKAK